MSKLCEPEPLPSWREMYERYCGRTYRKRTRRAGESSLTETRKVLDTLLGGAVHVRVGRKDRNAVYKTIQQAEWLAWVAGAKEVNNEPV